MVKIKTYLLTSIIIIAPSFVLAQRNTFKAVFDTTNIKGQFEYLYKKSSTYEQYKVVPINGLNLFKQNSLDSIQMHQREIKNQQLEINKLNNKLTANNAELNNLRDELAATQKTKNSLRFLWMEVSKLTYNFIMWGLLFSIALIATVLFLFYRRGHQVVKETKNRLEEVQKDFERHRKNALVREQKLARELMDIKLKYK